MKTTILEFTEPIEWGELKNVDLPGFISVTYGGSQKIHAIRCEAKDFEKVAKTLQRRKIAFSKKSS